MCETEPLLRLLTKFHLFCKKQENGVLIILYCRTKEAEVAALAEIASHSSRGQEEAQKSAAKAQAGTQRLEADIQRLQQYITHIENSNRQAFSDDGVVPCATYLTPGNQCVLKGTVWPVALLNDSLQSVNAAQQLLLDLVVM